MIASRLPNGELKLDRETTSEPRVATKFPEMGDLLASCESTVRANPIPFLISAVVVGLAAGWLIKWRH